MALQALPPSARDYSRAQRREIVEAIAAVKRQWRRMPPGSSWDQAWLAIEPMLTRIMTTAQRRIAAGALAYIPAVLEDTGQTRWLDAAAEATAAPLVGVSGDGRPVGSLAYGAVVRAGAAYDGGATAFQALREGSQWLTMAMGTVLSDTGRAAESLGMGTRWVGGYVRMLNPPSCSRCAVLAGKRTDAEVAFKRHPGCDCRNIPASESVAGDLTVNPHDYFASLTAGQQDRIFTKAGAEAIRSGADVNQVVNARRGMRAAQVGGRDVLTTSEGTTRRGFAYHRLSQSAGQDIKAGRYRSARRPRLMPETIRAIATDQADYLRLLRANGYLI